MSSTRKRRFYGGNAIVGGGLPLAVGLALADKMQGRNRVTCCFFGEGAAAEGEFHESLNLAALWKLPVLFVCENNSYAMGTALERSESETDIHRHAESYRIPAEVVDGMNVVEVEATARRAATAIRRGEGPRFMENRTYRFRAHSMFDPELYRDKVEVEEWKKRGPVVRMLAWLRGLPHDPRRRDGSDRGGLQTHRRRGGRLRRGRGVGAGRGSDHRRLYAARGALMSAATVTGAGIGAALGGMRPIVEVMTINFAMLALDQIVNNAATIRHMSGGQFSIPLVIRMATGAGRQLAAQHSHSLECWFAHVPGIRVVAPATVADARGMLWTALQDPDPVVIFEACHPV